jgi:glutamine amidotransferase
MCRWLAYQGNPIYLDQLVYQPEHSLVHQSIEARKAVTRVNADGFGLGWYTERSTPGQFHEVLPAWSDENLRSLAHHTARKFHAEIVTRLFWINGCFCITVRLASMKK